MHMYYILQISKEHIMHMYCINIPYQMPCKIHVPSLKGQNFCDLGSHIARSMTHKRVMKKVPPLPCLAGSRWKQSAT